MPSFSTPRCIFFDVGDVLFNEDRLRLRLIQSLIRKLQTNGHQLTLSDVLKTRQARANSQYLFYFHYDYAREMLNDDFENWFQNEVQDCVRTHRHLHEIPMPNMINLLNTLKPNYQLGIIADQPIETEYALDFYGFLSYFNILGLSEKIGLWKPDIHFFEWALDQANCPPEQAVMIGDRYDADIAPAKRVGMQTILFIPSPLDKGWLPVDADEELYLRAITDLPSLRNAPQHESETPDFVARKAMDILDYLSQHQKKTP